jgi:hypothetical protein
MVFAIVYLICLLRVNPYIRRDDDQLHMLAQTEIFLLLLAGNVFYNSPLKCTQPRCARLGLASECPPHCAPLSPAFDDTTDWGLSLTLIAIGLAFMLAFLYLALLVIRRFYRRWKGRKSPDELAEEAKAHEIEMVRALMRRSRWAGGCAGPN